MTPQDLKILAADFMSHPLSRSISDCEKAGEALFDAATEIDRLNADLTDIIDAKSIDDRFGGHLALMLECMVLNPSGYYDEACRLLDQYKDEWDRVNPPPPTFMGEPMPPERVAYLRQMKAKREAMR